MKKNKFTTMTTHETLLVLQKFDIAVSSCTQGYAVRILEESRNPPSRDAAWRLISMVNLAGSHYGDVIIKGGMIFE